MEGKSNMWPPKVHSRRRNDPLAKCGLYPLLSTRRYPNSRIVRYNQSMEWLKYATYSLVLIHRGLCRVMRLSDSSWNAMEGTIHLICL